MMQHKSHMNYYFSMPMTPEEDIPPPPPPPPPPAQFDQSPPSKVNKFQHESYAGGKAGKKSQPAQNGCPDSCGDCNTFFTDFIFPHTATNQADGTVEATLPSQKAVDTTPMESLLDKNLSFPTACSFASTLTQSSQTPGEYHMTPKDEVIRRLRLTPDERKAALDNCHSLRLQISNFEANFTMEHGRIPTTSADKAPLVDIYSQYREGKRCIRADAACRIQAACRGSIVRMRATKQSAEARIDELLDYSELDDASLLTTQMIAKYLTTEERKKIATKVLSEKLYHHKDQLALALPDNARGDEYMCGVCEMPKLAYKDGTIVSKCEVCPALNKKIILKKKEEKKSTLLMEMEKKKLAYEKEKLQQIKQQMEDERKKISAKEKADKAEEAAEKFEEKKATLLASATAYTSGSTNRNTSQGSLLREPLEVRARKRLEEMKAAKAKSTKAGEHDTKEYGFGQESFSNIINNLRADLKNSVNVTNTTKTTTRSDVVKAKADDKMKEESDEDDNLIDDPEITHVQRKIRGCPSPHPSEGATAPEDYVSKHRYGKNDEVDDSKSYGGFANKAEYDIFQETFEEFEREHADIVEQMRKKVGMRGRGNKATRRARSSSVPSVSSEDDSREFERRRHKERDTYRNRCRGHRNHKDYRHRRGGRRHEREQHYYDENFDSDSMSSESSYPAYERRRKHSSRPRRSRYDEYDRCDRGYERDRRYERHRGDCRDYYRDDYGYEPRRRRHERPRSRRDDEYKYKSRRRGKHKGHDDYHDYESYSSDSSGQYSPDIDRRTRHSRRRDGHGKEEPTPKPKTLTKPLGLN